MTEIMEKTWREQAKDLGIPMYRRKKVDVLADIEAEVKRRNPMCVNFGCIHEPAVEVEGTAEEIIEKRLAIDTKAEINTCDACGCIHAPHLACGIEPPPVQITQLPESQTTIAPVQEHEPWQVGDDTIIEDLYRRIEALENRVNRLVDALAKSKKVKGI